MSAKHLHRYLTELAYRFDRRSLEHGLFFFVLRRAAHRAPIPHAQLAAEAAG